MPMLNNDVIDAALSEISTNATVLHICSSEPANFAGVGTASLGTKNSPSFVGPVDGVVSGRRITVSAFSDGTVTGVGTASHYAIVDGSRLLAAGEITSPQAVTTGNTFTLTEFDIEIRDPA